MARAHPHHTHGQPSPAEPPLQFLLGHFRGEGQYIQGAGSFHKEQVGTLEAGGRFIALRMSVTYRSAEGDTDTHQALVIVSAQPSRDQLRGWAYTDGGTVQDYQLTLQGNTVVFDDRPPMGHGIRATRARKHLTPTAEGFEERLEIDRGEGYFAPYSLLAMQRVA